jgi:hypothetical protein
MGITKMRLPGADRGHQAPGAYGMDLRVLRGLLGGAGPLSHGAGVI